MDALVKGEGCVVGYRGLILLAEVGRPALDGNDNWSL